MMLLLFSAAIIVFIYALSIIIATDGFAYECFLIMGLYFANLINTIICVKSKSKIKKDYLVMLIELLFWESGAFYITYLSFLYIKSYNIIIPFSSGDLGYFMCITFMTFYGIINMFHNYSKYSSIMENASSMKKMRKLSRKYAIYLATIVKTIAITVVFCVAGIIRTNIQDRYYLIPLAVSIGAVAISHYFFKQDFEKKISLILKKQEKEAEAEKADDDKIIEMQNKMIEEWAEAEGELNETELETVVIDDEGNFTDGTSDANE